MLKCITHSQQKHDQVQPLECPEVAVWRTRNTSWFGTVHIHEQCNTDHSQDPKSNHKNIHRFVCIRCWHNRKYRYNNTQLFWSLLLLCLHFCIATCKLRIFIEVAIIIRIFGRRLQTPASKTLPRRTRSSGASCHRAVAHCAVQSLTAVPRTELPGIKYSTRPDHFSALLSPVMFRQHDFQARYHVWGGPGTCKCHEKLRMLVLPNLWKDCHLGASKSGLKL